MKVLLLVATERGRRFAERMFDLLPDAQFTVCSFTETPHEPRYVDAIRALTEACGHRFILTTKAPEAGPHDLLFAVSWRYIVPKDFYETMTLGAYVFHDSILPRYRGFSPTVWGMIRGDKWLGASLIKMAEGVDEGDIVDQCGVQVGDDEYIDSVMGRITETYLTMIERNIEAIASGKVVAIPQGARVGSLRALYTASEPTYCAKWTPDDASIDWTKPAHEVHNLIRATSHPYPGAFCYLNGHVFRIWRARLGDKTYVGGRPGRVVSIDPLEVMCGDGRTVVILVYGQGNWSFRLSTTFT